MQRKLQKIPLASNLDGWGLEMQGRLTRLEYALLGSKRTLRVQFESFQQLHAKQEKRIMDAHLTVTCFCQKVTVIKGTASFRRLPLKR